MAELLKRRGLGKFAAKFLEEEVNGSLLLEAGRDLFQEMGIKSALEWVRVAVWFRRELQGTTEEEPVKAMHDILTGDTKHLSQYLHKFQQASVDADMVLYAKKCDCHDALLKELGVSKALHRAKIITAVKAHYSSSLSSLTSTLR